MLGAKEVVCIGSIIVAPQALIPTIANFHGARSYVEHVYQIPLTGLVPAMDLRLEDRFALGYYPDRR